VHGEMQAIYGRNLRFYGRNVRPLHWAVQWNGGVFDVN